MPYKKETAYNNLPILPPHAELETVQILKKTVSAHKALARTTRMDLHAGKSAFAVADGIITRSKIFQ